MTFLSLRYFTKIIKNPIISEGIFSDLINYLNEKFDTHFAYQH